MRVAIYARYSSENQRKESIDDQIEECRRYAERQGWAIQKIYADAAQSGANKFRPEFQQMLLDARARKFDVVLCEALDRLARNLADVSSVFDELSFLKIGLHTKTQGQMTAMHIGIMGTMAQMALSDLGEKTRRGQSGRVRDGKVPSGLAYGYAVAPNAANPSDGGEREIKPEEAQIVRRIFREYVRGTTPEVIARTLNAEGVPGPGGREWINTTIRGQRDRGTGILNNSLYIGEIVWNRCSYVKDPRTRKRVARINPSSEWERCDAPHLRIIEQDLWEKAKARQDHMRKEMTRAASGHPLNATHRQHFLLSGLLTCGCCGGGYTITGKDRYGCSTRKGKGTCTNSKTITRQRLEHRVLTALRECMLTEAMIAEFVTALEAELHENRKDILIRQVAVQRELNAVAVKIEGMMQSIERGAWTPSIGGRLKGLETRQAELLEQQAAFAAPPPKQALTVEGAALYRKAVAELETALNDPLIRNEAAEALRSLIEKVVLEPDESAPDGLRATLHGELASLLALSEGSFVRDLAYPSGEGPSV